MVRVDYKEKFREPGGKPVKVATNAVRTAGMVARAALADRRLYEVIKGSV